MQVWKAENASPHPHSLDDDRDENKISKQEPGNSCYQWVRKRGQVTYWQPE